MKRAEQLEQTRTAILVTARKLFLKNGYQNTSTRDIAGEIGITQPALYHHFNDKEVIFLEVIAEIGKEVRNNVNKVMRKQNLSADERLFQITKILTKIHHNSITTLIYESYKELSASGKRKLEMLFKMNYIAPLADYFKLPEVNLRAEILPDEAAELYLSDINTLFGSFNRLGGHQLSNDERVKLILKFVLYGIAGEK
ncbi:TetR/AcrR family transcriptional regulator [Paucilactobacillus suebicus]|uniref:Transcriptional regulator n=1 Tax=Paucilactobacillus suebicus DSM 5007 = KCTC 3549 TaxID=1423807 RepID=A0A0R1W7G8_9LACO|nr:TetR/AcrR family transcriptional regulator [Paucilactobacillus suebicus]KRM13381.1 transcriptional regulator [Paucilactobacillus suebicus DSM 5007 = KCTC 3549]